MALKTDVLYALMHYNKTINRLITSTCAVATKSTWLVTHALVALKADVLYALMHYNETINRLITFTNAVATKSKSLATYALMAYNETISSWPKNEQNLRVSFEKSIDDVEENESEHLCIQSSETLFFLNKKTLSRLEFIKKKKLVNQLDRTDSNSDEIFSKDILVFFSRALPPFCETQFQRMINSSLSIDWKEKNDHKTELFHACSRGRATPSCGRETKKKKENHLKDLLAISSGTVTKF